MAGRERRQRTSRDLPAGAHSRDSFLLKRFVRRRIESERFGERKNFVKLPKVAAGNGRRCANDTAANETPHLVFRDPGIRIGRPDQGDGCACGEQGLPP